MREKELARMSWKIKPEDLMESHREARGQFGSRYSLGKFSVNAVIEMNESGFKNTFQKLSFRVKRAALTVWPRTKKAKFLSTLSFTKAIWWPTRKSVNLTSISIVIY